MIRSNYYWNHHAKFEIDRTILTYLNQRKELTVTDGRTDPNYRKFLLLTRIRNKESPDIVEDTE